MEPAQGNPGLSATSQPVPWGFQVLYSLLPAFCGAWYYGHWSALGFCALVLSPGPLIMMSIVGVQVAKRISQPLPKHALTLVLGLTFGLGGTFLLLAGVFLLALGRL